MIQRNTRVIWQTKSKKTNRLTWLNHHYRNASRLYPATENKRNRCRTSDLIQPYVFLLKACSKHFLSAWRILSQSRSIVNLPFSFSFFKFQADKPNSNLKPNGPMAQMWLDAATAVTLNWTYLEGEGEGERGDEGLTDLRWLSMPPTHPSSTVPSVFHFLPEYEQLPSHPLRPLQDQGRMQGSGEGVGAGGGEVGEGVGWGGESYASMTVHSKPVSPHQRPPHHRQLRLHHNQRESNPHTWNSRRRRGGHEIIADEGETQPTAIQRNRIILNIYTM